MYFNLVPEKTNLRSFFKLGINPGSFELISIASTFVLDFDEFWKKNYQQIKYTNLTAITFISFQRQSSSSLLLINYIWKTNKSCSPDVFGLNTILLKSHKNQLYSWYKNQFLPTMKEQLLIKQNLNFRKQITIWLRKLLFCNKKKIVK